jgi:hypothetical protein
MLLELVIFLNFWYKENWKCISQELERMMNLLVLNCLKVYPKSKLIKFVLEEAFKLISNLLREKKRIWNYGYQYLIKETYRIHYFYIQELMILQMIYLKLKMMSVKMKF